MKTSVLILCGGRSDEHEISLISARGILDALDRSRYLPVLVGISREGVWHLETESSYFTGDFRADSIKLNLSAPKVALIPYRIGGKGTLTGEFGSITFDVVFPILHGPFGEDGTIQGLFDIVGIPYVGSGCQSSAVCMDKELTKVLAKTHHIPIADFTVVHGARESRSDRVGALGFPLFVKPARLGSSIGISKVRSAPELEKAVIAALKWGPKCLIEKAVSGREIECAVLGHTRSPIASLPAEIIPSPSIGWYSYEAKYLMKDGAETHLPARLSESWTKRVQEMAIKVFQALECEGMARVDFFLDEAIGNLILNEVNTIPGFTPISMYPKMWAASGVSYPALITRLLDLAVTQKTT